MMTLETIAKIRRDHLIDEKTIKQIVRDRGVSRNTVRKALREGAGAFVYKRKEQPRPLLGAFVERLESMLDEDWPQPRKRRLTAKKIYEDLEREGYQGAYDSVRRFVKSWREEKGRNPGTVFVPLQFDPGSVCQFDWSYEQVVIGGIQQTIKLAHFRLSYSRMLFVMAFQRESLEMLLEAHNRAFEFFGGCGRQGVYDNLSTAVNKVLKGKEREFNTRFAQMCDHFLMEPVACTPAAGWEKGQVENQVRNVRRWFFSPIPHFADMEELNGWLADRCWAVASERTHPKYSDRTVAALFQEERERLIPYPGPFEAYQQRECRASSTSLVTYDKNQYSVDCFAARKPVTIRAYANRIVVLHDGQRVANHPRTFSRGSAVYNPWHYLKVLERKPGALRHGAPFQEWDLPDNLAKMRQRLEKKLGGDRKFVELLSAGREHGLDEIDDVCAWALKEGIIQSDAIVNRLLRINQPPDQEPVETPARLILKEEPTADCARYDRLLEANNETP